MPMFDVHVKVNILVLATSASAFRLVADTDQQVLRLDDGLPVEIVTDKGQYRTFVISADTSADLSLSVSPFYGDPDFFLSPAVANQSNDYGQYNPQDWPTIHNFTWASIAFGADTEEIQAEDLAKQCSEAPMGEVSRGEDPDSNPNPSPKGKCDVAISVYSWSNSSYIIQASLNHGWQHPIKLLFGQAQMGYVDAMMYKYYEVAIGEPEESDTAPFEVAITLTSTEGGDQDLYITSDRSREPGRGDYDQMGVGWAASDTLLFTQGMEGYCTNCTIYLAVYGFTGGRYSILASQGL
ncbi:unnamed protein product, partial [Discosporangium mesarthrocarpum]